MPYPPDRKLGHLSRLLVEFGRLMHEYGATAHEDILREAEVALKDAIEWIQAIPISEDLRSREPNSLPKIMVLRNDGPRRIWKKPDASYGEKLEGALLARMMGCTKAR